MVSFFLYYFLSWMVTSLKSSSCPVGFACSRGKSHFVLAFLAFLPMPLGPLYVAWISVVEFKLWSSVHRLLVCTLPAALLGFVLYPYAVVLDEVSER